MCDGEQCHVAAQLISQRLLDDRIRLIVDRGRRLIKDEQLAAAHESTSKCENLPLTDGEVATSARDLRVKRDAIVGVVVLLQ